MSSSGGTDHHYSHNQDTFAPQQHSMRSFASRDGYAPSEKYNDENPPSYSSGRRRSSVSANSHRRYDDDDDNDDEYWGEPGEHTRYQAHDRSLQRRRSRYDDDDSDSDSLRGRSRSGGLKQKLATKTRSLSRLGKRMTGLQSRGTSRERDHDLHGNNESKKWGATVAGALAGGLAGKAVKKDQWLPAALGAVLGGLAAREAEKEFYKHRETDDGRRER